MCGWDSECACPHVRVRRAGQSLSNTSLRLFGTAARALMCGLFVAIPRAAQEVRTWQLVRRPTGGRRGRASFAGVPNAAGASSAGRLKAPQSHLSALRSCPRADDAEAGALYDASVCCRLAPSARPLCRPPRNAESPVDGHSRHQGSLVDAGRGLAFDPQASRPDVQDLARLGKV